MTDRTWDAEPTAAEYDSGDVVGMADEDRYGSAYYWETHTVNDYLAERYGLGRGR